jgi:prevent-host-death family protein
MSTVTLEEAKQQLDELVKKLPTEGEIVITSGNTPIARLSAIAPSRVSFSTREELEEKLLEGIRQLDAGKGIPLDLAREQLKRRAEARRKK